MITQADVDNSKLARDNARALLEAYWNGNPDGKFSIQGWVDELAKCSSSNASIAVRNAKLEVNLVSQPVKGSCSNNNFELRRSNLFERLMQYQTAHNEWGAKAAAYDKILQDFKTQTETQQNQAQTQQAAAQTGLIQAQSWAAKYQNIIIIAVIVILIAIAVFIYFKWFRK